MSDDLKDRVSFLSRNIGDWQESDAGWCCDTINLLMDRLAKAEAHAKAVVDAYDLTLLRKPDLLEHDHKLTLAIEALRKTPNAATKEK